MARVHYTALADQDYHDIWDYIARNNPRAADALLDAIDAAARQCAEYPGIGRRRDEFLPDLRSYPLGKYQLFYTPTPDGIRLLRVLHGARDLRRFFQQP